MPKDSLEWDIDIHVGKGGQGAPNWLGCKEMWIYPSEGHAPVAAELAHAEGRLLFCIAVLVPLGRAKRIAFRPLAKCRS